MGSFRLISYDGLIDVPYDDVFLTVTKNNNGNSFDVTAVSVSDASQHYVLSSYNSEREAVESIRKACLANSAGSKRFYEFPS